MRSVYEENRENFEEGVTVSGRLLLLLFLGFIIVIVGIAVILVASVLHGGGSVSGGAVIFIGPFPIVIGAGPDFSWIVLFCVVLAVLSVVASLFMNRKMKRR